MTTAYNNSTELMRQMAEKSNGTALLAFSLGKDSLCAWVEMKKYFHTIIPVHYYRVPNISFVERSVRYYEAFFNTKIIQLPDPSLIRMLNNGMFQTAQTWEIIKKFQFPKLTRELLLDWVREDLKLPSHVYVGIGNRMYDNLQRYRAINKYGAHNDKNKTFYPVYDYRIADVIASIKSANIKLPIDYKIWGKTFDGLNYRFIKPIKQQFPDDYQKIKSLFPLIDLQIARYEQL